MTDNIINTFQQRRQLTQDMAEMASAENELALRVAAQEMVDTYPTSMIQAEVLKNLDTPDSQLRGGLGQIAALLPRDAIAPALRSIAVDRSQSAQSRLTAVSLLSQFLDESVPQALIRDLNQANRVALQSLHEAVDEGRRNRHVLLEYVTQMRQAGDHIAPLVIDLLDEIPAGDRIELLRLLALDDRERVAALSLEKLERLASLQERTDARRALHTLRFMISSHLSDRVVDMQRRLRFTGRTYTPPDPVNWRAMMTLPNFSGWQSIWFVRMPSHNDPERADDGAALFMGMNVHTGALRMTGDLHRDSHELPPDRTVGTVVPRDVSDPNTLQLLEAPFDYARWRVLEAIPKQWELDGELPGELRLYGDLLTEFNRPEVPADYRRFHNRESSPNPPADAASLRDLIDTQPNSKAFDTWLQYNRQTITLANLPKAPKSDQVRKELIHSVLSQLDQQSIGAEIANAMADSLRAQAAWFHCAGEPDVADLTLAFAVNLPVLPLSQNPLMAAILDKELQSMTSDES